MLWSEKNLKNKHGFHTFTVPLNNHIAKGEREQAEICRDQERMFEFWAKQTCGVSLPPIQWQ